MERGQIVIVYEDPHTKEKEEGKAELLRVLDPDLGPGSLEYWEVKFLDDGFITGRVVG